MTVTFEGILASIGILLFFIYMIFILPYEKTKKIYEDRMRAQERIKQKYLEYSRLAEVKRQEKEILEKDMRAKGLEKVVHRGKEIWAKPEQIREWKFIEVDLENNFHKLSPAEFEKVIGDLFKKMNYDVRRTPVSGDYGADIIVKKDYITIVVQCKKYDVNNKVGAPEVQRTLGSMHRYNASKAILVTTSEFTKQARTQALKAPIDLWDRKKLREQFEIAYLKH